MRNLSFFIVSIFCCIGLQIQAQEYLFTQITPKEGLASITPNYIAQDAKGYMWFGGNSVLQRYDGFRFQTFHVGKGKDIPGGNILGVHLDNKNRLWLLTGNNNLGYLDADNFSYHPVKIVTPAGFENAHVALQVNKQGGIILIYVDKGITTFNEAANEMSAKYNAFIIPKGWEPRHLVQDEEANYWICSANGLLKYNSKKKLLSYRGHNQENDPVIKLFEKTKKPGFIYTLKNISWVLIDAEKPEIYSIDRLTGETKEWYQLLYKALQGQLRTVWGVQLFNDGSTWFNGAGLFAEVNYEKHSISIIQKEASGANSIRYDDVFNMYQDREKNNWVCTNMGLFRFNPSAHIFKTIKSKVYNSNQFYNPGVTAIIETKDHEILTSTLGSGIFSYDTEMHPLISKTIKRTGFTEAGMAWSLLQTKRGDIWMGYQNGLIGIYDAVTKKINWQYPEIFKTSTIRQLAEDKFGNVWLGTQGGTLIKWDAASNSFQLIKQLRRHISKLYVDSKDNIWAATENDGVYCIHSQTGKLLHYYAETGEPGKTLLINGATDINQYDDTTMIIAGGGLNILNTKTHQISYLEEGTQISSLVLDAKKNLWFTSNTFVVCRPLTKSEIVYSYNEQDGISNFSFQTASAALLSNGNIVFGTNHDLLLFNPEKALSVSFTQPPIQVSGIFVGDKQLLVDSIMQTGKLKLKHFQNSLILQFTNNQYQTRQLKYYRVDGLDKSWKPLPPNGELQLTYLAPGKYIINTTSFNEKQQPGSITSIEVIIAAPFYKQWWFFSLLALTIIAILVLLDRQRSKRREALLNMRAGIAGKLHEEVHTALGNINILSEMAKLKADASPEKSKEFIAQINQQSSDMIVVMDDMLWSINPDNDSMDKTLERFKELVDALMNRHAVPIEFRVDEQLKKLQLPMQMRQDFYLLLKESLQSLAAQKPHELMIHISKGKAALLFLVVAKGINLDEKQFNSIFNNKKTGTKMDALKAKLDLHVTKNNASMECTIPVL